MLEPEKCERWDWFELDQLPSPLFVSTQNLVKTITKLTEIKK